MKEREGAEMTLQELVDSNQNMVFLGGAGVSTESGIPDFRSVDGLHTAAGLVDYYRGKRLVLINRSTTPYDSRANAMFRQPIGQLFKRT